MVLMRAWHTLRRARRTNRPFSAGLALGLAMPLPLVALVCWISVLASATPEADDIVPTLNTIEVKTGPLAGARVIRYFGFLSKNGNARLFQYVDHTPKDRPLWLEMNSPGGDLAATGDLTKYLAANGIGVSVSANAQCSSACVLLYASAERRYAPSNSYSVST